MSEEKPFSEEEMQELNHLSEKARSEATLAVLANVAAASRPEFGLNIAIAAVAGAFKNAHFVAQNSGMNKDHARDFLIALIRAASDPHNTPEDALREIQAAAGGHTVRAMHTDGTTFTAEKFGKTN